MWALRLDVGAVVLELYVVLELGKCWRWAIDVCVALVELRGGVGGGGSSWMEVELGSEMALIRVGAGVGDVGCVGLGVML